eukprot:s520_g20.t1
MDFFLRFFFVIFTVEYQYGYIKYKAKAEEAKSTGSLELHFHQTGPAGQRGFIWGILERGELAKWTSTTTKVTSQCPIPSRTQNFGEEPGQESAQEERQGKGLTEYYGSGKGSIHATVNQVAGTDPGNTFRSCYRIDWQRTTSCILQPFSKSRAEREKEEAELRSLKQLHTTLKAKPLNELTDDVKKATQVAEQHARKEDAKMQLQKARKRLGEVEEQWNAFRVQWFTYYLNQASKLWMSHVEKYELGENRFSTSCTSTEAALDDAMNIGEQDLSAEQEAPAQAKQNLVGIAEQVRTSIEARVRKRDRSIPKETRETEEIVDVEELDHTGKKSRESGRDSA